LTKTALYPWFIPRYSKLTTPLNHLKRKNVKLEWGAYDSPNCALCRAPTLQLLDFSKEFVLQCDTNDIMIVAVLNQRNDSHLASVAFVGKTLSESEKLYPFYEKNCLVVMFILTMKCCHGWGIQLGQTGRWILI
jgi:hypothetical protein